MTVPPTPLQHLVRSRALAREPRLQQVDAPPCLCSSCRMLHPPQRAQPFVHHPALCISLKEEEEAKGDRADRERSAIPSLDVSSAFHPHTAPAATAAIVPFPPVLYYKGSGKEAGPRGDLS